VILDNYEASFEAVSHLIEKGHRKIGMIAYKSELIHMQERVRGYVEAMKAKNLENEVNVQRVRYSNLTGDTEKVLSHFTTGKKKVDALLFATSALTIAGLYVIKRIGLKVPEQLAIIGFDGNETYDFFYSPLTYIEQPISEIGKEAVRLLLDQISGSGKVAHMKIKHNLIVRNSSL
jgi:LacI family transcriptional regulator